MNRAELMSNFTRSYRPVEVAPLPARVQCAYAEWLNAGRWFGHDEPPCSCKVPS